jgi:hypothetical protein
MGESRRRSGRGGEEKKKPFSCRKSNNPDRPPKCLQTVILTNVIFYSELIYTHIEFSLGVGDLPQHDMAVVVKCAVIFWVLRLVRWLHQAAQSVDAGCVVQRNEFTRPLLATGEVAY